MSKARGQFRVQLAYKEVPWDKLRYPVYVSPKLDGIRCYVDAEGCKSRKGILLPNQSVQQRFRPFIGFDGELIVGHATPQFPGDSVYGRSESGIMSQQGSPHVFFYVFDLFLAPDMIFSERRGMLLNAFPPEALAWVRFVPQTLCHSREEIEEQERIYVDGWGFEGAIVRGDTPYKYGRSTPNDQVLLKMKRWSDAEAKIIGFQEEMHNGNEATVGNDGLTKRGHSIANKTGKGRLGAFEVVDLKTHEKFTVDGFTHADKETYWAHQDELLGQIITYKHFLYGAKDKPRQPKFKGFRNEIDL